MNTFRFDAPIWLCLILVIGAALLIELRRQRRSAILYSSVRVLKTLPKTLAQRVKATLPWIRLLGLILVVVALARPQHGREEFRVRTEGIAIEMVCDRSGSMQAMDFEESGSPTDRLSVVKRVFRDFVAGSGGLEGRPDDMIGLVVFGGYADSRCPLTLDHGALLEILENVEVAKPMQDSRGRVINEELLREELATAVGDALTVGVQRLEDVEAKSKVLILLSDGEDNFSVVDPLDAAEAAASRGIKVYTIGIGSNERAPMPMLDMFGQIVYRPVQVSLDEELLKEIAEKTDGQYFNARDTAALEAVYEKIDALEKTETEGVLYTEYRELFQIFLLSGLGLIVLELMLSMTRFRTLP